MCKVTGILVLQGSEEDEDYHQPYHHRSQSRRGRGPKKGRPGRPQTEDISGFSWGTGRKPKDKSDAIYPGDEGDQVGKLICPLQQ